MYILGKMTVVFTRGQLWQQLNKAPRTKYFEFGNLFGVLGQPLRVQYDIFEPQRLKIDLNVYSLGLN